MYVLRPLNCSASLDHVARRLRTPAFGTMRMSAPLPQQRAWASRSRPRPSSSRHGIRGPAAPAALFQFPSFPSLAPASKVPERPLYKPSELVQMGPFKVSPMGFGTWSWGNQFLWGYDESMDPELQEVFNLVVSSGVNLFDTADSYGTGRLSGRSEQLLGQFIEEYPGSEKVRSNVRVATKLAPYPWRLTTKQWVDACKASLKRTRQEKLALGQLHWSTANYAPPQERVLWDALVALYDQGLVEAVGVSNYGPKQLLKIHSYLEKRGIPLAAVQVQYSLLSCGPLQQSIKAACDDLGVTLIAYSPLALGLLTGGYGLEGPSGGYRKLPGGPRGALFKQILPGAAPLLSLVKEIAARRGKTPSQVAVNWCICQGTVPIPGAKDLRQAKENLGALGWRLSAGEVAALNEAASKVKKTTVQNIFQTN